MNDEILAKDPMSLVSQIVSGELNIRLILSLLEKINSQAFDQEICNSLFALAEGLSISPPPALSISSIFTQTPWKTDISCYEIIQTSEKR